MSGLGAVSVAVVDEWAARYHLSRAQAVGELSGGGLWVCAQCCAVNATDERVCHECGAGRD